MITPNIGIIISSFLFLQGTLAQGIIPNVTCPGWHTGKWQGTFPVTAVYLKDLAFNENSKCTDQARHLGACISHESIITGKPTVYVSYRAVVGESLQFGAAWNQLVSADLG